MTIAPLQQGAVLHAEASTNSWHGLQFYTPFRKLPFGVCKVLQPAEGRAECEGTLQCIV